jgi:hypothetical protein
MLDHSAPMSHTNVMLVEECLQTSKEALARAHTACIAVDEKFAHEIAQVLYSVSALRDAYEKRIAQKLGKTD